MYEIPKIEVPVDILLMNAESLTGMMFVTEDLLSAAGNPELQDFLNRDHSTFFPFVTPAGAHRLINKHHVVMISCEEDDSEIRSQTPLQPKNVVFRFTNDRSVFGAVFPTQAEETRVSDLINQDEAFLVIYNEGQKIIVNRHHIVYASAN